MTFMRSPSFHFRISWRISLRSMTLFFMSHIILHPPSKHTTNLIRELKILHLGSAFNFRIKNMQKSSRYHGPTTMHTYDRQALLDPLPTVLSGRILASVSPIPHPFPNHPCAPSALTLRRKRTKGAQDLYKPCAPFCIGLHGVASELPDATGLASNSAFSTSRMNQAR